jgi:hypothetical protein
MKTKLRTTALAVSLIAAATPSLSSSAEAAPWGWRGGWHGGWHGGGWGGFGLGLAAAALIGGALAAPYYDYPYYGYAPGYYGYPSYSYGYGPAVYGYRHYGYRYASVHRGYRHAGTPSAAVPTAMPTPAPEIALQCWTTQSYSWLTTTPIFVPFHACRGDARHRGSEQ